MLSALEGSVELKGQRFLIVNTGSLSYRVFVTSETLRKLPEKGQKIKLWTHLYSREDTQELYGFLHYAELEFFETLIQIPGIGPKSGLGIMSVTSLDALKKAIAAGDTAYLTKVSGIGRKTAEKVVLELKEKLSGRGLALPAPELKEESDALSALISLGYTHQEAREALSRLPPDIHRAKDKVREALRQFGQPPSA